MKVGIRHWHWHWLLCSTSVPPTVPNMREVKKEIRPTSAPVPSLSHPGDPHNPGHPPKPFRPACSLHRLFTLLPGLSRYQDRHQHVRDAQDNIKRLWCFWRYFKYIIISSHVTMMDMIIWWCAGHSHTGELQVFDCINLASRVSPFLHQPLPYTTAEKLFFNSFFPVFQSFFCFFFFPNRSPQWGELLPWILYGRATCLGSGRLTLTFPVSANLTQYNAREKKMLLH